MICLLSFNVGTRIIREALKGLEVKGLVLMKQGKGAFVRKQKLDFYLESLTSSISYDLPQNKKTLIDLTRTREIFEIKAIHKFFDYPDYGYLEKLSELVEEMRKCKSENKTEEYRNLDLEFHKTLVSILKNDVINYMYKHLTSLLYYSVTNTEEGYDCSGFSAHLNIVKNMDCGDLEGTIQTIKNHFKDTIRSIQSLDTYSN